MPPDLRVLGLGHCLPPQIVSNEELAAALGEPAADIAARTGIAERHRAADGEGPSDLALRAARDALAAARTTVDELGLIVFATATPDVTFPGAACYLQEKLGAPTVGALDVRAQTAGFLCALDLASSFAAVPAPRGGRDARYARMLIAAGEVHAGGLDATPRGRDMTPRFGDGAAAAVVGQADSGPRLVAVRWTTEGELADRFWCEYPASYQTPVRITAADIAAGKHFPRGDLAALAPIARDRLGAAAREVLDAAGWRPSDVDLLVIDYVDPAVAGDAGEALGVARERTVVPTREFGHVMAGGIAIALARRLVALHAGARALLVAAGPGFTYGAAALEA
ncbi:MAG TPA: 3-oxoacyl-[acyl-carrier-protein] synthase III C-terminal domain-containing protein [Candidatus Binatia bacterium]|nr:3-oxoacyl-[acyl-carrier-protein] synthase III C-terminal domain-containing protein [Candidatus Binatia bacterium]